MNIKKISFIVLLICVCLINTGIFVGAEGIKQQTTLGYDFPVKPGTTAWNEMKDRIERVTACQVPETILRNLTTDELIETIFNYPFLMDIYAYDSYQQGFESVSKSFNGLAELFKRGDAATKLLAKYQNIEVATDVNKVTARQIFDISNIEVMLAQDEIKRKLNYKESSDLEKEVENKFLTKKAHPDIYGLTAATFYAVSKEKQSSGVRAEANLTATYYVYTPNGTAVAVLQRGELLSPAEKASMDSWVTSTYPGTTVLRTATTNYNCHSYAWYSQSTSNVYWMNDPSPYWTDGSYTYTSNWRVGYKMYYDYPGNAHSAIITACYYGPPAPGKGWSSLTEENSKWGSYGLVRHMADNCPYYFGELYMRCYYR